MGGWFPGLEEVEVGYQSPGKAREVGLAWVLCGDWYGWADMGGEEVVGPGWRLEWEGPDGRCGVRMDAGGAG